MYIAINDTIIEYSWFDKNKIFDLEEFEDSFENFKNHLEEKYLFQLFNITVKEKLKHEFDVFVSDFF